MIKIRNDRRVGEPAKETRFRVHQQKVESTLLDRYERDHPKALTVISCNTIDLETRCQLTLVCSDAFVYQLQYGIDE